MRADVCPEAPCRESCCVMRYAWQALTCIDGDVAVVVHGPNGCGADFSLPSRRPNARGRRCATDLSEMDAVMGGEAALERTLEDVCAGSRPKWVFVLGTCVSELIGDDARAVCTQVSARRKVPIVFLPTSGLVDRGAGDAEVDVAKALVERVMRPGRKIPGSVNFIAFPWAGYLGVRDELSRRLRDLGLRLNAVLTGTPSLEEVVRAPRAALDVVVSDDPGRKMGRWMQERFGIPFLEVPRPMGIQATSRMFQLIFEACTGRPGRVALVEAWKRHEARRLSRECPALRGKTLALIAADPDPALVASFSELGLEVSLHAPGDPRGWKGCDLAYSDAPEAPFAEGYLPLRHLRPPASFLMYPGMRALASELEAELESGFFRDYGRYCR